MIRKPTIFVLVIVLGFAGLYMYSRHDLIRECPDFFHKPIPAYVSPAGTEEYDDMATWTGCTEQDPIYLDMEQWAYYFKFSGVLVVLLFLFDLLAHFTARSRHRDHLLRARHKLMNRQRRVLRKLSRLLGGL